jgi:hypothetical protein
MVGIEFLLEESDVTAVCAPILARALDARERNFDAAQVDASGVIDTR